MATYKFKKQNKTLNSFKEFKEACRKNKYINGFTGRSRRVIEMIYVSGEYAYCGKVFETNNMQVAYTQYKTLIANITKS